MRGFLPLPMIVVFASFGALSAAPSRAEQPWPPGEYMVQALAEMLNTVRFVSDKSDIGYDDGNICLIGVLIQPGEAYSFRREFRKGMQYALVTAGDEDVKDVDIEVLDEDGELIVKDDSKERDAWVEFTPRRTESLTIRLILAGAKQGSFCTLAFLKHGGIDVPKDNFIAAGDGLLNRCQVVQKFARDKDANAFFLGEPNQAAVFGALLAGDETIDVTGVIPGRAPTVVVGAGDRHCTDLDLAVLTADGDMVEKDTAKDAIPTIAFTPERGESYGVKLGNATSKGKLSMTMFGVLQLIDR